MDVRLSVEIVLLLDIMLMLNHGLLQTKESISCLLSPMLFLQITRMVPTGILDLKRRDMKDSYQFGKRNKNHGTSRLNSNSNVMKETDSQLTSPFHKQLELNGLVGQTNTNILIHPRTVFSLVAMDVVI